MKKNLQFPLQNKSYVILKSNEYTQNSIITIETCFKRNFDS